MPDKIYTTLMRAVDVSDGVIKRYGGQRISARSFDEAEKICREQYPYLEVEGELVEEIEWNMNEWICMN